jgi:hypothetical protein
LAILRPYFLHFWLKSGHNTKKIIGSMPKAMAAFKKSHAQIDCVRFSLSGWRAQDWMRNVPLYAMSNTTLWTKSAQLIQ